MKPESAQSNEVDSLKVAYRQELYSGRREVGIALDKAIMSLAAGGLATSLVIVRSFAPLDQATHVECLIFTWISFAASVVSQVLSQVAASASYEERLEELEDEGTVEPNPNLKRMTIGLTRASVLLFIAGVALLVAFATLNALTPASRPTVLGAV